MYIELIIMSLESLISNKIRSLLSILWIIIWVSTIIVIIWIWLWAQKDIEEQYKNLSVTSIIINPINTSSSRSKLWERDSLFIQENAEYVENITALMQGKLPVSYAKESQQFTILWIQENFFELNSLKLIKWRKFNQEDIKSRSKSVILSQNVIDDLFNGDLNVLDTVITVWNKRLTVIWITESSSSSIWPITFDDVAYLPFSTASKNVLGSSWTVRLIAQAIDIDSIFLAMEEMTDLLRKNHRLKSNNPDDFRMKDQGSKVVAAQDSAKTMSLLLTLVAIIVLIVSGIWVMNVMLVSVSERTKEIWILKAIWAKQWDILFQFLLEAVVLSIVWWVIWVFIGIISIPLINNLDDLTVLYSLNGVILWLFFSMFVGVLFWFYPALKASKFDPVDALRSE